ncbi:MAG: hypothetical protein IKH21_00545 [Clostridia bacterium]|nr:hypothetical protein [Clostridia bacterium]MBR3459270.1 hypothetical protein [Clostridia bacterium]
MKTEKDVYILPDLGGIIGGLPHPAEKEIRRKELPGAEESHEPVEAHLDV